MRIFSESLEIVRDEHKKPFSTACGIVRRIRDFPTADPHISSYVRLDRAAHNIPYFDFLDRLASTYCTEGLNGLSFR